jgi:hypothetical protein
LNGIKKVEKKKHRKEKNAEKNTSNTKKVETKNFRKCQHMNFRFSDVNTFINISEIKKHMLIDQH